MVVEIIHGDGGNSSSRDALSKLFGEIIEWRAMFSDEVKFQWSELHLSVVRDYVLRLDLNSRYKTLRAAKLFNEPQWNCKRHSIRNNLAKVAFFTLQLLEFFKVPTPQRTLDRAMENIELVAAFINFLLQLLSHRTDVIGPLEDRVDSLQKDLRFLYTVLGDGSLLLNDHEQVQDLLANFENVANEAGRLAHSFTFCTDLSFRTMNEDLNALFSKIGLLNNNIIQFSAMPPSLGQASPRMAHIDSLFNVHSFVCGLYDLMNQDNGLSIDVKSQIKALHQELKPLLSFLKKMKTTSNSEIDGLKPVETRIRDVAYEAEYLITSFLVRDAPIKYFLNRLSHVFHKVELAKSDFQQIKKDHDDPTLQFPEIPEVRAELNSVADDYIVGFEESTIDILDQLVGDEKNLEVISISGMPGLGKTTIAKKLYNHPCVKDRFQRRSWCVASQTYNMRNLLSDILVSVWGDIDKSSLLGIDEGDLANLVHESLWGRRYLIVIDDIWEKKVLDDLRRYFPNDKRGSRILITSRNTEVIPPDSKNHELPSLTEEQCWKLLEKRVFRTKSCPLELLQIGKEIAANCGGLPLMVVVVSGILSTLEKKESEWKKVGGDLHSSILADGDKDVMQILGLSYSHLSEHLKPCFLYFGAFPEDTEISARKLTRLWVAEGFVREESGKNPECVAEEYLLELIDRSLVIVAKRRTNGGVKACLVHDLLRDFCLKICKGEEFLKFVNNNDCSILEKGHRLLSHQRSVTPFGQHIRSFQGYILDSQFYARNMRLLRVLTFKRMLNHASVIGIEYLIHLRYLVTNELTALIGKLLNLEYLFVENKGSVKIPSVILKMVKLRHLQINHEATFDDDCSSSQMNNLEVLSSIILKKQKDEDILKCSPLLRKLKCTCEPLLEDMVDERCLDLHMFTQLESLNVQFSRRRKGEIIFPSNVVKLTLSGMSLPWDKMSIIGRLLHLKVLKLGSGAFVGDIWVTFPEEFRQLRFLKLEMLDLAEWIVEPSHFPTLEGLAVYYCSNLREIPIEIGEIAMLQEIQVQFCPESVEESAMDIQKDQWNIGNYKLKVIIREFIPQQSFQSEMMALESSAAMLDNEDDDNIGSGMDLILRMN